MFGGWGSLLPFTCWSCISACDRMHVDSVGVTQPLSCDSLFLSMMVQQTTVFDDKLIFIDSFIDPLFVQMPSHLCTVGFDHCGYKFCFFSSFFKSTFYSQSPCLSCSLKILH